MRRAQPVTLNTAQCKQLDRYARGRQVAVRLALRARIVLLAAHGLENKQIAAQLGVSRQLVARWRTRFLESGIAGIGSQPCPLGLVQPLQPGGRSQAGRGSPQGRPGRPLFKKHPSNRPAPLILNRQPSREKVTTPFGVRQILFRSVDELSRLRYIAQHNEHPTPFIWVRHPRESQAPCSAAHYTRIAALPARTVQPLRRVRGPRQFRADHFSHPSNRPADRKPREGDPLSERQNCPISALRSAFGVCHSRCFCRPCPSPARAALSFRVRVWAFSAMRG